MTLRNNPEPEMLGPGGEEIPEMLKQEEAPASALQPANKEQKEEREEAEKQEQEQEQEQLEDIEKEFDQEQDTPENEGAVMPPEQPEQPKTFTDRMIKTAERLGESLAKMMEKLNDWASSLGLSALNGLKTVAAALGWTTAANFLEKFVRPAEVRQLIADNIPESSKVVRDASDADAIRKLEQAYADEVKANTPKPKTEKKEGEGQPEPATPAQRSFMEFCEERVNKLPKEEGRSYKIADLLRPDDREPDNEKEAETKPEQEANGAESLNEQEKDKVRHLMVLAEALQLMGIDVSSTERRVSSGRSDKMVKTNIDMAKVKPETINSALARTLIKKLPIAIENIFKNYQLTHSQLALELDGSTLELDDGGNWVNDPNIAEGFEPSKDPKGAISTLLLLKVSDKNTVNNHAISPEAATKLRLLQQHLRDNIKRYGSDIPVS